MTRRRILLDEGVGETRGVVVLDGRPERLLIARETDVAVQALGAQVVARLRSFDRALGLVFLDLGEGADAVLTLRPDMSRLSQGRAVAVEIRAEARGGKGASARLLDEAVEGPPRLLRPGPSLVEELERFAPGERLVAGAAARAAADEAESEALETVYALAGGGSLAIERTRALVAVDVDVGERAGGEAKRAARAANLAAMAVAARALRLKGEGGLVMVDLAGRGHDGPALLAAARAAFAADGPGVAFGPVSRFGTLEFTIPRRRRSIADRLLGADGQPTAQTLGLRLLRAMQQAAEADPGGRITARAAPDAVAAAAPYLKRLHDRFGARLALAPDPACAPERFEIACQ